MSETAQAAEPKKAQKKSVSYALKAIDGHVETLKEGKLLNSGDERTILEITKKAKEKYIKEQYGL